MKLLKKKSIISLISTLVFIFPLIYQPIHVVLHHNEHHTHKDGLNTTVEKCLAYEYQFATYDLPEKIVFLPNNINIHSTLNSHYNKIVFSTTLFLSGSRAPPTFS